MKCPKCGEEPTQILCPTCRTQPEAVCIGCGTVVSAADIFAMIDALASVAQDVDDTYDAEWTGDGWSDSHHLRSSTINRVMGLYDKFPILRRNP